MATVIWLGHRNFRRTGEYSIVRRILYGCGKALWSGECSMVKLGQRSMVRGMLCSKRNFLLLRECLFFLVKVNVIIMSNQLGGTSTYNYRIV